MYKLVASDLDGTLLNKNKELSEATRKFLEENNKFLIVPTTGKILSRTKELFKDVKGLEYIIAVNGSIIYDVKNDEIIHDMPMEKDVCLKLLKMTKENTKRITICTKNKWIRSMEKDIKGQPHLFYVDDIEKHIEVLDENIYRLNIHLKGKDEKLYKTYKKEAEDLGCHAYITRKSDDTPKKLVVIRKDVSKKRALSKVLELEGIKWEEVIAFGDNQNDKGMLMQVGRSVAMKNAPSKIRDIVDFVTEDTNDEDGVVKYLNSVLEEKYV
ncbi:MAG: HAD-IIB family hydrolase [Clostridia bacterium]|jgi:Cof subfamily protein (haloacid dehalogenase superfamily)|nr:HAD-IIB family hydrolase [Clostridia bacterium]